MHEVPMTPCPLCQRPIEPTGRRGRPRQYCDDRCSRVAEVLLRVGGVIGDVADAPPALRRHVRSALFSFANEVPPVRA